MKISTATTTSPGRAEKYYPPPLLRFLRSNVGSKSRGRTTSSRSSPLLFINRRRSNAGSSSLEVQQEPTSPKVTCMGQVRVKRNSRTGPTRRRRRRFRWRCKWVPSEETTRPCSCVKVRRPAWPKWVSFSCTKKRRPEEEEEEEEKEEVVEVRSSEGFEDEEEEEEGRRARVFDVGFVSPPKNALLLTRSRSAPYRSSSLACRFWGSPLGEEGIVAKKLVINKVDDDDQGAEEEDEEVTTSTSPTSKRESLSKEEEREEKATSINPTSERVSLSKEEDPEVEEEEEACSSSPTPKRSSLSKEEDREEEEAISTSPTSKISSLSKEKKLEEEEASTTSPTSKRASLSKEEEEEAPLVGSVEELQGPLEVGIVVEESMPAILTRCKSEPARTGVEKLGRRLGFT